MNETTKPSETIESDSASVPEMHRMVDMGSAVTKTAHGNIHCLTIVGQIEGHTMAAQGTKTTKYEHVMPLLAALEENDEIAGVLFLLNTMGGDVEAGLGIAELITSFIGS